MVQVMMMSSMNQYVYECFRTNTHNIILFFFLKTQRIAPQRHPTVPTVSRPLKDLDVKEGQPIQLTCQVQGFPKSEVYFLYILKEIVIFMMNM